MNKIKNFFLVLVVIILGLIWLLIHSSFQNRSTTADILKTKFIIEGEPVTLSVPKRGPHKYLAETGTVTKYFGNEIKLDFNNDGRLDTAFIVVQNRGGSGTFYYAVFALNTVKGFVGSDGYFLGDRIAPQSTNLSPNPRHQNVIVFNYADRAPDEPMTATPTIGKSVYLKPDLVSQRWGIVSLDMI